MLKTSYLRNTIGMVKLNLDKIKQYLQSLFKDEVSINKIEVLGKGWHAETWRIIAKVKDIERSFVFKQLKGEAGFGHDYPSDRAAVLLMAHKDFNKLPNHVKSIDVGYIDNEGNLYSVGNFEEFFIIMEEVKGEPYINDLRRILRKGEASSMDYERLKMLVDYLVDIHKVKYSGDETSRKRLYLRRIRDLVGHGEMIFGVIDSAYPFDNPYRDKFIELEKLAIDWRWKLRQYHHRLSQVHGDYHPFNIRFTEKNELIVMDRSRGEWGEPADDVSCITINYLWFSLLHTGKFNGVFSQLFKTFMNDYIDKTGDEEMLKIIQPWYSFRAIVIASPLFYPENPEHVRNALIRFAINVLKIDVFSTDIINDLIKE